MAQNKKSIKAHLNKINKEEKLIEKIGKYLTTKRGIQFVNMLHRMPLKDLCKRYNAQFMLIYDSNTKNMNIINASIRKFNIQVQRTPTIEHEPPEKIKCQMYLTAKQRKDIIARNTPKKFGFAALMHAYEEHKMAKFEKKHPAPTKEDLAQDLFPGELEAGYRTQLWIHREYVRDMLCKIHSNIIPKGRYYRVFKVYKKNTTRGSVISECEMDMPMIAKQNASRKELKEKLLILAKSAREADKDVIKVKLYDKYGNPHLTHTFLDIKTSK